MPTVPWVRGCRLGPTSCAEYLPPFCLVPLRTYDDCQLVMVVGPLFRMAVETQAFESTYHYAYAHSIIDLDSLGGPPGKAAGANYNHQGWLRP